MFHRKDKTKTPKMYYRNKSSFCAEHFCENLDNNLNEFFSAQPALNIENFNKLFNQFAHIILSTIDTHASLKSLTRKETKVRTMDNKRHFRIYQKTTCSNLIL